MSEVDEDAPISGLHKLPNEDNDISDEFQDFRFLSSITSDSTKLPKRGEKDFEPHGTKHQDGILESSRAAMHEALAYERIHVPKNRCRAFYYGDSIGGCYGEAMADVNRQGLTRDHLVRVDNVQGPHFRTMGTSTIRIKEAALWLLPEEALYLVERGSLDLWWAPRRLAPEEGSESSKMDEGAPMSLQAAYAMLIGDDDEVGKISMERYTVYDNLRRNGYVVTRAPPQDDELAKAEAQVPRKATSLLSWLMDRLSSQPPPSPSFGPLVQPGLYRSYDAVYQKLSIIPRHQPSPSVEATPPEPPFQVVFHVMKPNRIQNYSKKNPGDPDYRVAVVSARTAAVPTLNEIQSLLESTPFDPPKPEWAGITKSYQRLKHGWRNVILAVVDQGISSYIRVGEAAFGEEKLYERFQRGPGRGRRGPNKNRGGRRGAKK